MKFEGVGLPKNNDISRGYCSQIAIFTKKIDVISLKCEENKENKDKNPLLEEIFSVVYPFETKIPSVFLKILRQNYK